MYPSGQYRAPYDESFDPMSGPGAGGPPPQQGGTLGGGFPSPAPPQEGDPKLKGAINAVLEMVRLTRMLSQLVPGALPEIRKINDELQRIQPKIQSMFPIREPMAPPV